MSVETIVHPKNNYNTKHSLEEIISLYGIGVSASQIARDFGTKTCTITSRLKRHGITIRKRNGGGKKIYSCNESFFSSLENEESAYWAGFIAADGTVDNKRRNRLIIQLAQSDLSQLEKFLVSIGGNSKIRLYDDKCLGASGLPCTTKKCCLTISSSQMVSDLISYGIGPRKTDTVPWPNLSVENSRHFLRGYSDGDGCWSRNDKSGGNELYSYRFRIWGNYDFLAGAERFIRSQCATAQKSPHRLNGKNICCLDYQGKQDCIHIANLMYSDSGVAMERKKEKVILILNGGS